MRAVLDTQPDLECVGEVADGRAATEAILSAPGNDTRVLVLTTYDSDDYVYRALSAGAGGFLLKSLPPEELVSAMRVAARGDALIDPSVTRRLVARFATSIEPPASTPEMDRLTGREREVLLLIAQARSNAEIAEALCAGKETVKTHVSRVLAKLGLRDRVHAVVYAYQNSLVTEGRER
jgi:DNA-binding NarL/FixJ family response regulator